MPITVGAPVVLPTLPPTLGAGLAFDDSAAIPVAVLTATTDTTPALTVTVPANLVGVTGLTIDLVVNGTVVPSTASTITVAGVAVDVLTPTTPLAVSATPYNLSYQLNLNGNSVTSTALPITVGAPIPTPAVPTGVIDNVGTLLGNVLANGTTDDSTASLAITAPAVGQAAVLYVNGIETTSVFAVAAGLMPSTLTPVGDLGNGQYQLSYAYRDVATGTTGAQSPTINITVTPASTVSIDTIGAAAGTLANDVFELNTPLPLSGLTINSLLDSATTLVTGGLGIDTLAVTGTGQTLDLTLINDLRITNIEKVDLTGSGNNTLKLNLTDVLAISPTVNVFNNTNGFAAGTHDLGAIGVRNQLIVDGNVGDTFNTNGALASLTNVGNVTHQGLSYNVFQNAAGVNAIELLVNQNLTVI